MTPTHGPYRELTVAATVFGVAIGAVMTAAFVFVALKLGFSLPGSTVAAILGFAVLRGVLRKGTIVENNINQTMASAVNSASAGVGFTLPALFILGVNDPSVADFDVAPVLLSAIGGAFLGVFFIIPLRKQMLELERLRFPSGIAVASLLKSPGAGARQAKLLAGGFAVAMAFHLPIGLGVIPEEIDIGSMLGAPPWLPIAVGISFASIGSGLLSGKGGLPFVFGAILAWWVLAPASVWLGWVPSPSDVGLDRATEAYDAFIAGDVAYSSMLRPLGIGILIGGALSGVVASFPAVRAALRGLSQAAKAGTGSDELPPKVLYAGIVASFVVLFGAAMLAGHGITIPQALVIAVVGTVWLGLAGLIVAQSAGMTDISPISGMSLIGVTLMFFLSGGNVVTAIILGIAVSMGIGQCADMMTDLKSGHLIGATPKRQQIGQLAVAWIGVPIAVATVYVLWGDGGGFGPGAEELTAPQGSALAAVIESLKAGNAPLDKYVAGAAIGLGLGVYPVSGVGVLVGLAMYLPFYITMTYGLGCFGSILLERRMGRRWMGGTLVPVAAGFIIGEALTSLTLVVIQLATGGGS